VENCEKNFQDLKTRKNLGSNFGSIAKQTNEIALRWLFRDQGESEVSNPLSFGGFIMAQCVLAVMPTFPKAGKFENHQLAPTTIPPDTSEEQSHLGHCSYGNAGTGMIDP
jgi:hypothetical protein